MSFRAEIFKRVLATVFLIPVAASCGGKMDGAPAEAPPLASFAFPADGVPNNQGYVGPFCCSGQTGIVKDTNGAAIGYSYFYGFGDGENLSERQSVASSFSILVAGCSSLAEPSSPLVTGQVDFEAGVLEAGVTKSVIAGALEFEVVIDHADIVVVRGQSYFDMGTIAASVVARPAPSPTP